MPRGGSRSTGRTATRHGIPVGLDLTVSGMGIQPLIHDQFPDEKIPVVDGLAGTVRGRFRYLFEHAAAIAGDGTADLQIEAVDRGSGLPIAGAAPVQIRRGVAVERRPSA